MELQLFIVWIVSLFIGGLIGMNKGQETSGFIWPLLLGPLGVLIVLALPNNIRLAKDTAELKLRAEELRVQKAILREMQSARSGLAAAPPSLPSPPSRETDLEEFVPESLRRRN